MASDRRPPRILWVTEEPPDRRLGGGNIREAHLFEALSRVAEIDLLVVGRVDDDRVRAAATAVVELPKRSARRPSDPVGRRLLDLLLTLVSRYPLSLYAARPGRRALAGAIRDASRTYELVCVEHEALAPLVPGSHPQPWIITFHHLLSGMLGEELELAPGRRQRWIRARDLRKARRLEREALARYDRCIVCSDEDAASLAATVDGTSREESLANRIVVIPNGVDLGLFRPSPVPAAPRVLLPGTLSWQPNVDGALWFCAETWRRVRAAVPDATLILAGRSPAPEVRALVDLPGVSVHADVPSMVPYFESARVVVVPLRIGTGTRLKALEAMATARPVVGTSTGLAGLGVVNRVQAHVADDPGAFASAVIRLLQDDEEASSIGKAGRSHVESSFGWETIGSRFAEMVCQLVEERRTTDSDRGDSGRRAATCSSNRRA